MAKWISILATSLCAGASAFIYETHVNPGHGSISPLILAGIVAFAASIWAWFVFPHMGKQWAIDLLTILLAYPAVGALAGILVSLGSPIGAWGGVLVAVSLPLQLPKVILPIYFLGAVLAFVLPRTFRLR